MSLPNTFVVTGDAVMQLTCSGMHGGCRLLAQRSLRRGPNRRVQAMVGLRRIACGAAFCAFAFWTQDADAATAAVDGTILETAALGDGGAERCMVRVDASLPAAGLDCDGDWVAFDCWAERGAVPGGDRMRASLRLALAAGKRVELLVADDAADGVCRAEWIKVQDETDEDADADGDGVANLVDDLPLDPSSAADLDGDGQGDEVDIDDDGDGIPDTDDPAPRLRNEAPLIVGQLPNRTVFSGRSACFWEARGALHALFSDPDGDSLALTMESSEPARATAYSVNRRDDNGWFHAFCIRGEAAGRATFTLTATDPSGLSAALNFHVIVNPIVAR